MGFFRLEYWSGLPFLLQSPNVVLNYIPFLSFIVLYLLAFTLWPGYKHLDYRNHTFFPLRTIVGLLGWLSWQTISLQCKRPGVNEIPWRRKWQTTPVFLPGESNGQRSLAGYSPWGPTVRHDLVTKPPSSKNGILLDMFYNCPFHSIAFVILINQYTTISSKNLMRLS